MRRFIIFWTFFLAVSANAAIENLLLNASHSSSIGDGSLSTALLVLGTEGHDLISRLRPVMRTLLVTETNGTFRAETRSPRAGSGLR